MVKRGNHVNVRIACVVEIETDCSNIGYSLSVLQHFYDIDSLLLSMYVVAIDRPNFSSCRKQMYCF